MRDRSIRLTLILALGAASAWLWNLHGAAWNPGLRTPILGYEAAQYALAARTIVDEGRMGTTFALPIELAYQSRPPWPLSGIQPGLVLIEAAWLKLAPPGLRMPGRTGGPAPDLEDREWLALIVPFACYVALGIILALVARRLLRARGTPAGLAAGAAGVLGLALLLDPECQHLAMGGFTELPFTLGLILALGGIAFERAARRPLLFGLLLGVTALFRADAIWLVPALLIAALAPAPAGSRRRAATLMILGLALPLAPWWFYKWQAFGSPLWDVHSYVMWDDVQGHTWLSLSHLPERPVLPGGIEAAGLLSLKALRNLPGLFLDLLTGPRALWLGALGIWLMSHRDRRGPWVAGSMIMVAVLVEVALAAVSTPSLRHVFPARVALEAAGILALWDLTGRLALTGVEPAMRTVGRVGIAVIALAWGGFQTLAGLSEAHAASTQRGIPASRTLAELVDQMDQDIPSGEPVMSNLGPTLAWRARRPVIHLALSPDDVAACRERIDFRHVILAFRDASRAWPGWRVVLERPAESIDVPEWNVASVREFRSDDAFTIVWLELGPVGPGLADASRGDSRVGLAAGPQATPPAANHRGGSTSASRTGG